MHLSCKLLKGSVAEERWWFWRPTVVTFAAFLLLRSAFLDLLTSQNLSLGSLASVQDKLIAVLLQAVQLKSYSAAELVAAGKLESALSEVTGDSYPVTFSMNGTTVGTH